MNKIIELSKKNKKTTVEVPSGASVNFISPIEHNVLRSDEILPKVPPEQEEDMKTYHKRYVIAQGVDHILKRADEDEALKGKPLVIVVYPQEITVDDFTNRNKLTTKFEIGTLVKAKFKTDSVVEIQ